MCLFGFLCFNGNCGFHVYRFLIDCIFQGYVSIMFLYKVYVYVSRPFSKVWPCFTSWICFYIKVMFQYPCLYIKCLFMYWVDISCQRDVSVDRFLSILRFIIYFEGYVFLCLYVSLIPSIQKTFIQKLNSFFASFHASCLLCLTFVTFSFYLLLLCFTFLGCF